MQHLDLSQTPLGPRLRGDTPEQALARQVAAALSIQKADEIESFVSIKDSDGVGVLYPDLTSGVHEYLSGQAGASQVHGWNGQNAGNGVCELSLVVRLNRSKPHQAQPGGGSATSAASAAAAGSNAATPVLCTPSLATGAAMPEFDEAAIRKDALPLLRDSWARHPFNDSGNDDGAVPAPGAGGAGQAAAAGGNAQLRDDGGDVDAVDEQPAVGAGIRWDIYNWSNSGTTKAAINNHNKDKCHPYQPGQKNLRVRIENALTVDLWLKHGLGVPEKKIASIMREYAA